MKERIYHITSRELWQQTKNLYRDDELKTGGFIHCSYPEQLVNAANSKFHGQKNLVILVIERSTTNCRVVDENLMGGDELFPHVYGPIPISSVLDVYPFPCDKEGFFHLPEGIGK